jgi:glutamate decarboxylase
LVTDADPSLGQRVDLPQERMAEGPLPPDVAYQLIHDELLLDGSARLNLATFVTTWMEPQARLLIAECVDKNMIDKDEYPQTAELERRCVAMLADLWHAPTPQDATGCSTTGSSEACMLAGMALQRRWAQRVNDRSRRPNLVMGANVQVCWEKFCRYWDVEPRIVPMKGDRFHLDAQEAVAHCDEDTIGVVAILGSTFDGSYEPVAEIAAALDKLAASGGPDVPVHVDGASGAMIAPFLDADLVWDFQLPRVASINTSGHKYGLVYPGVGWVLWRDAAALPQELIFNVNYLGGQMATFNLNFSRPGGQVVCSYYNFLRLGRDGYRKVQTATYGVAAHLAAALVTMNRFELLFDGDPNTGIPAVTWRLRDPDSAYSVFDIAEQLRSRGWLVPAYTLPAAQEEIAVQRIIVRHGLSLDMADLLLEDMARAIAKLESRPPTRRLTQDEAPTFTHDATPAVSDELVLS